MKYQIKLLIGFIVTLVLAVGAVPMVAEHNVTQKPDPNEYTRYEVVDANVGRIVTGLVIDVEGLKFTGILATEEYHSYGWSKEVWLKDMECSTFLGAVSFQAYVWPAKSKRRFVLNEGELTTGHVTSSGKQVMEEGNVPLFIGRIDRYVSVDRTEVEEVLPDHIQMTVEIDNDWYMVTITEKEFTMHDRMDNLKIEKSGSLKLNESMGIKIFKAKVYPFGRTALFMQCPR